MKDVCFLIHGSYGNPYKNFLPYLHKSITKKGYYVIVPQFPIYSLQTYDNWSDILEQYLNLGLLSETSTIITHSLGSIFIVKFLKEHNLKIKKLITVAGFNNITYEDKHLYNSFYLDNTDKISVAEDAICICSTNDKYVSLDKALSFAKMLGGKVIKYDNTGHFSSNDGYQEFRDILKYL